MATETQRTQVPFESREGSPDSSVADPNTKGLSKADAELADRLAHMINETIERLAPMLKMIRKHVDKANQTPPDELDEQALIDAVKPLLEQCSQALHETLGAIKGADPDGRLSNQAKRNMQDHKATPEEQRLAEALKKLTEDVMTTIEEAKNKIADMPKAKNDLGPLLDALGQPLFQIVGGVGLLLGGVLNLLGNLLDGLGLGGLLRGITAAVGLDKIFKGIGLDKFLNGKKK